MSLGLLLMLIEDAGDVRHALRFKLWGDGSYGILATLFEFLYFSVIGMILIYASLKYHSVFWKNDKVRNHLVVGYLFYGLGVSLSFIGSAFDKILATSVYEKLGDFIFSKLLLGDEISIAIYEKALYYNEAIAFMIMDMLLEESLELVGAAGLLTAGVYFFANYNNKDHF